MWMSTWDQSGNRISVEDPYDAYLYIKETGATDAVSIFGDPLKKMVFKKLRNRTEYAEFNKRTYFNLPIDQQYLIGKFAGQEHSPDFGQFPLRIFFLDIEVYAPNGFPKPEIAKDEIVVITVYESTSEQYYVFGNGTDYYPKEKNVTYFRFEDELSLLKGFIRWWRKDFPDVICGWYSYGFDVPYLCNRINNVYGDPEACFRLSPVDYASQQFDAKRRFGAIERTYDVMWNIRGITHIDMQAAYFKFSQDKLESYSLNSVCEHELGEEEQKLEREDVSIAEWWKLDPVEFIDYNVQDVRLLVKLEEKLKYIGLCRQVAYLGLCRIEGALGTLGVVTGLVALEALNDEKIISTFDTSDVTASFKGGYVSDPIPGFYRSIVSFDANSMYPNSIVTLNISPETKLGSWVDMEDGTKTIKLVSGAEHNVSKEKFEEFVEKLEVAKSPNNIMFSQKVKGILPRMIDGLYSNRVAMRNKRSKCLRAIKLLEESGDNPNMLNRLKLEADFLDMRQYSLKILMNSAYGAVSEKHFALFDLDLSAAVTSMGRKCIQMAESIIDECAEQIAGKKVDVGIYIDTDSRYFSLEPILKIENQPFMVNDKVNPRVYELADIFENYLNEKMKHWATVVHGSKNCTLKFKREALAPTGLWQCAKIYVVHCRDIEGFECDEFKYTGMAVVRSSTPKKLRPMLKEIIETLILTQSRVEISAMLKRCWNEYKAMDFYDKVTTVTINNLIKYTSKSNELGENKIAPHTPRQVAAAIRYNRKLVDDNLHNKYESIKEGDKIKLMYFIPSASYNFDTLGFKNKIPVEWESDFIFDDVVMFDKTVVSCLEKVFAAVSWDMPNPTRGERVDLLQLFSE